MRYTTHKRRPDMPEKKRRITNIDLLNAAHEEAAELRRQPRREGWSVWTVSTTPAPVSRLIGTEFAVMPFHGWWIAGRWHDGHGRIAGTILGGICSDLLTAQMTCEKAARDAAARLLSAA